MFAEAVEVTAQSASFATSASRLARRASHRVARHLPFAPRLMRNNEPLVSFTFDDVPVSAHTNGASMIEAHGARATFYVATGLLGQYSDFWTILGPDEVADLHLRGHEIGLHSHRHAPASSLGANSFADDIKRNREALSHINAGIDARNFAYPFGQCTLARKHQLNSLVRSSRSIYAGVNRAVLDPHYVRATELCDARLTPDRLETCLDRTHGTQSWLVFCMHDVSDMPSAIGCSRRFLDRALEGVARRGMRIVTVDAALDLIAGATAHALRPQTTFSQEFSHG
jgi:peptidoglycan/xylan/chitin deacetylase (PgdA/CDA1 family)